MVLQVGLRQSGCAPAAARARAQDLPCVLYQTEVVFPGRELCPPASPRCIILTGRVAQLEA